MLEVVGSKKWSGGKIRKEEEGYQRGQVTMI